MGEQTVEPVRGRLNLDTTFVPASRDGVPVYVSEVRPGDTIYIAGSVRSEIDLPEWRRRAAQRRGASG
ncbi:hypothetical protein [Sorangium sp. So ce385]|uniref:hypothetical protein n=1 Tax=Sorangium sp. So ce385 TaxID=3133308 RepID=UPI003F5B9340